MLFLEFIKIVCDFFKNGRTLLGLATIAAGTIGYVLYLHYGLELACLVAGLIAIIAMIGNLPSAITKAIRKKHVKLDRYRTLVNNIARTELLKCLSKMKADRIFVTEGHNGTQSATELSFLYMDVTYLETSNLNDWIKFDYRNLSTSLFPCFDWIAHHGSFVGTTDDLSNIDNKIVRILESNATRFVISYALYDEHNSCIGTVVATYTAENIPDNIRELQCHLQLLANKLERLFTKQWSEKELEKMASKVRD